MNNSQGIWKYTQDNKILNLSMQKLINSILHKTGRTFQMKRKNNTPLFLKLHENRITGIIYEKIDNEKINPNTVKDIYKDFDHLAKPSIHTNGGSARGHTPQLSKYAVPF